MKKKILIVTPRSPFQGRGADELDRLTGIEWFIEQGFKVTVITKTMPSDVSFLDGARKRLGIEIISVPYKFTDKRGFIDRFFRLSKRIIWPPYWDGASFEYFDNEIQFQVGNIIENFKPELVWFDYTYLWPLYHLAKEKHIPIITRSINFEPTHFLDEDKRSIFNLIRVIPKYLSEVITLRKSSLLFCITPKEEGIYKQLSKTPVYTLPLRVLPHRMGVARTHHRIGVMKVGFMPSTYSVHHNLDALLFLVNDIFPLIPSDSRDSIEFHITGNRIPDEVKHSLPSQVVYEGFVPNSKDFWDDMDVAFAPSLFGAGMQMKIFEPIALGVPTVTQSRGFAGYPFVCGEHVLCAENPQEFAHAFVRLFNDYDLRKTLSSQAQKLSIQLFSKQTMNAILKQAIHENIV